MKQLAFIFMLCFVGSNLFSQQIQVVRAGGESDSSLYHLARISSTEFWAGGEHGILKSIDSLGNISSLNIVSDGMHILKIERVKNYVFVLTDNATIYRYNIETRTFIKGVFPNFNNKCFYDMVALPDGNLLVCGGAKGISKAKKEMPHGFIALVHPELNEIHTVWRSYRKFVWSLLKLESGKVLAATFNGLNTKIISTESGQHWQKNDKVKGLVHEIAFLNSQVWYSGATSIRYRNNGIIGVPGQKQLVINNEGCLWSMDTVSGNILTVTSHGKLLIMDAKTQKIQTIKTPSSSALFDIEKISDSKLMVVGHGGCIYIIDLLK